MTTAYTSLLGLALPVTGELQGTWGDTVNNSITSLLDTAVAGTTTLSTDSDVTLSTTTGAANQARQAIILWTANGTATRNITAPAQSKIYTVINASAGTQSIVFRGAGPTTGVTLVKGESALVAWNGSDFIKISNTGGAASFTNVTVSGTTTLSGLTASTALALNASKEVVSVTNTGTGNNVLSTSPTLTGTVGAAALTLSSDLTLSGGTANGVAYLNGSKVLTTGSALTFDGTNLGLVGPGTIAYGSFGTSTNSTNIGADGTGSFVGTQSGGTNIRYNINGSEQMRLTSTGLGIGTSSPSYKLDVNGTTRLNNGIFQASFPFATGGSDFNINNGNGNLAIGSSGAYSFQVWTNYTQRLIVDSSGNVGIGTSSPAYSIQSYGTAPAIATGGTTYLGNSSTVGASFILRSENTSSWTGTREMVSFDSVGNGADHRIGTLSIKLKAASGDSTLTEYLQINPTYGYSKFTNGNLGLGVTPSAWSVGKAFETTYAGHALWSPGANETIVSNNAYYNSGWKYGGSAAASYLTQIDGAFKFFSTSTSGTAGNAITFTQAMTLDASGNLLVGLTTGAKFSVSYGGNDTHFGLGANYDNYITAGSSGVTIFRNATTERARIDSSGNLLVGTTTNRGTFTLQGYPTSLPTASIYRDNTDANYCLAVRHDAPLIGSGGTGYMIKFEDRNGGTLGSITSSGTGSGSTAYNTSSDYRLKHDVAPMTGAIAKVATLKPCTYKWNADNSDGQGFIAHELQEVFPEAVTGAKDEMEEYVDEADGTIKTRPRYQGIDTSFLVATLTAAIQEQQAIITELRARVSALEAK